MAMLCEREASFSIRDAFRLYILEYDDDDDADDDHHHHGFTGRNM
jgi:hypothetical protein